jgi:hypothetical protein
MDLGVLVSEDFQLNTRMRIAKARQNLSSLSVGSQQVLHLLFLFSSFRLMPRSFMAEIVSLTAGT